MADIILDGVKGPDGKWQVARELSGDEGSLQQNRFLNEQRKYEDKGRQLAELVYTPEGQKKIEETRRILTEIVDATTFEPEYLPGDIPQNRLINERLLRERKQRKADRIGLLLSGVQMNDTEAEIYLVGVLGKGYDIKKGGVALRKFESLRLDIGQALNYQGRDAMSNPGLRALPLEGMMQSRDAFLGISVIDAREEFARGWDSIKFSQIPVPMKKGGKQ